MSVTPRDNHSDIQNELRQKAKELLTQQRVNVVIGYGLTESGSVGAVFITNPDDCEKLVWNEHCITNLVVYLKRKEIKALGKAAAAVVVKGCDSKALAVLEIEKQLDRDHVYVLGVPCNGVLKENLIHTTLENIDPQIHFADKCAVCDVHQPLHCDYIVGTGEVNAVENTTGKPSENIDAETRYAKLETILKMSPQERFVYWKKEFDRCFKCYACRQVCPMCYCEVCVADKNRPTRFDTSATPRGNFAWHTVRAFHLAGRCIGCGNCASACPAGIDLDLLNLSLAKAAESQFDFRAGFDRSVEPLIGSFSQEDDEQFIR